MSDRSRSDSSPAGTKAGVCIPASFHLMIALGSVGLIDTKQIGLRDTDQAVEESEVLLQTYLASGSCILILIPITKKIFANAWFTTSRNVVECITNF